MTAYQRFQVVVGGLISSSTTDYEVKAILGSGTFGLVAQCRKVATNETVALKILKTKDCIEEAEAEEAMLKKIKELDSDRFNIVSWKDTFTFKGHFCLEFEKLDISLCDFLQQSLFQSLDLAEIHPIMQQLATALKFLKSAGITHSDLKPQNIMMVDHVRQPLRVKVIDFGSACDNPKEWIGSTLQTLWYRAPEVLLGCPFTEAIDVWSLGCIAAQMLMGTALFRTRDEYNLMRHIVQTIGKPPDYILNAGLHTKLFFHAGREPALWTFKSPDEVRNFTWNPQTITSLSQLEQVCQRLSGEEASADACDRACFVDLLSKMLKLDAADRITPSRILQHPFITMSHHVCTFDNSSYVKMSIDKMSMCQGETSNSTAGPSCHSHHAEGHSAELSGSGKPFLQSPIISRERRPALKRKWGGYESECGNRSKDTKPAKKRRDAAMKSAELKRQRDDADLCAPSDDDSPAKKRRSMNVTEELADRVNKLQSSTAARSTSNPVHHLKMRKRDDEASGSAEEKTSAVKRRRNQGGGERRTHPRERGSLRAVLTLPPVRLKQNKVNKLLFYLI